MLHAIQRLISRLDYQGIQHALFEWADSYDSKDWDRLAKCIAPTLRVGRPGSVTTRSVMLIET